MARRSSERKQQGGRGGSLTMVGAVSAGSGANDTFAAAGTGAKLRLAP
jgi:hypothetical protein